MTYELLLPILLVFMTLLLGAVLVFLYLQSMRQMRESYQSQSEALAKTLEIQLRLTEGSRDAVEAAQSEASRSLLLLSKELISETLTSLQANQETTIKTVDLMATRVISGLQAFNQQTNETLRSTVTMIGTKDPLAYQMVRGASFPENESTEPYTSADEVAERQANLAALAEAEQFLLNMGVPTNVATGPGSYSSDIPD